MSSMAEQIKQQFERYLTLINQWIWPADHKTDRTSMTFFVFKPFPKNLKNTEIKKWASLQSQTLSPFSQGDRYTYLSKKGLHAWFSPQPLSGIPETAAQTSLPEGQHTIASDTYIYQQQWKDGCLIDCIANSVNGDKDQLTNKQNIVLSTPWAMERKLDKELKKPASWLTITLFLFFCGLCWVGAGYLTIKIQQYNVEQQNTLLADDLGEKLAKQTQLRDQQMSLSTLHTWQQEQGFFPESFGIIVNVLNEQGVWKVNQVTWQNKNVELEFVSADVDITSLIGKLEKLNALAQVNIRPHNAQNTWVLEAKIK